MMKTDLNLKDPDAFYEAWLDAQRGLDEGDSAQLNARLVLLLANQIGDDRVLAECVAAAARPFAARAGRP
jgi:hypothetical protein